MWVKSRLGIICVCDSNINWAFTCDLLKMACLLLSHDFLCSCSSGGFIKIESSFLISSGSTSTFAVLLCVTQQRFALVVRLVQCVMRETFLLCSVSSYHAQASESCGHLHRLTLFRQGIQTTWHDCYCIAVSH